MPVRRVHGSPPSSRATSLPPRASCIRALPLLLNITEDHLAWHRTHEAYAAAKRRIFANLDTGDLAVISMDDPEAAASAPEAGGSGAAVLELALEDTGAEHAAFVLDGMLTVRLTGTEHALVPVSELGITGDHNVTNALAASAAALWVGADPARVAAGLRSFALARASHRTGRDRGRRALRERFQSQPTRMP